MSQQPDDLRHRVRERYAAAASAVTAGRPGYCCGDGTVQDVEIGDGFGAALYPVPIATVCLPTRWPPASAAATRSP